MKPKGLCDQPVPDGTEGLEGEPDYNPTYMNWVCDLLAGHAGPHEAHYSYQTQTAARYRWVSKYVIEELTL